MTMGDRVVIRETSLYYGQHPGVGTIKVIHLIAGSDYPRYEVIWSDGYSNYYSKEDIKMVGETKMFGNRQKNVCKNCTNGRLAEFTIHVSGQKLNLCKTCWMGLAMGLKKDIEMFMESEHLFRETMERTKDMEKELTGK